MSQDGAGSALGPQERNRQAIGQQYKSWAWGGASLGSAGQKEQSPLLRKSMAPGAHMPSAAVWGAEQPGTWEGREAKAEVPAASHS